VRILYLAHRVPFPPNKGEKIRSYHELKHLSRRHEIHLIAFCDQPEDLGHAGELRNYCRSVELIPLDPRRQRLHAALSMARRRPWSLGYFENRRMRSAVDARFRSMSFESVVVYSSPMAQYVLSTRNMTRLLDFVDSDASKWMQYAQVRRAPLKWLFRYEAKRLAEFERRMVREFDASIFVSPRETLRISDSAGSQSIHFAQNGVDLDYFAAMKRDGRSRSIVFTGTMDYFPNVDAVCLFARDIFPRIRSAVPDAEFTIVGNRPTAAVLRLSTLPGVRVTGAVADVRTYLGKAAVAVAPVRISQGVQNKVLEALASGLPVVATSAAAAGLVNTEGLPLSIADQPALFADHVIAFMKTPLTSDQVRACRRSLAQHFDWESNLSVLDSLLEKGTPSHHRQTGGSPNTAVDYHEQAAGV
jgi:polysaccharide biosynthesis protein PslH